MKPAAVISRRSVAFGAIAAAVTAAVAGAIYEVPRLFKRRASGEYADLVNLLNDPEQAAMVGRAMRAEGTGDAGPTSDDMATELRGRLKKRTLPELVADDTATATLVEADGWILPGTLADLCLLAAQSI